MFLQPLWVNKTVFNLKSICYLWVKIHIRQTFDIKIAKRNNMFKGTWDVLAINNKCRKAALVIKQPKIMI